MENKKEELTKEVLKKLNYEQLEQLLIKQAKENIDIEEKIINKEVE
jgi:hypothetical protein